MGGEDKWEHIDPKLGWGLLALGLGKDRAGQRAMARAQCSHGVTIVWTVTNTYVQWCFQGEGLKMLGGSGETPLQCLHQGTALSWVLGEQHVKEHPGQCRSGHAWQHTWSRGAPKGKACPPKAT